LVQILHDWVGELINQTDAAETLLIRPKKGGHDTSALQSQKVPRGLRLPYSKDMFEELNRKTYASYLNEFPFYLDLGLQLKEYTSQLSDDGGGDALARKITKNKWNSVDPNNKEPFPAELDDLIRLHYLVTSRKVTKILEFGVGKSTVVFDHALSHNKSTWGNWVKENLRRTNPFECHSVDNSKEWIETTRQSHKMENVFLHYSKCHMGTFNDRVCTFYDSLPNVCPDLIYLDAPDQFSVVGEVRGISTRDPDRLPMSADILALEHFLLPGTLIVVDGRTANARFIKSNLQRSWTYTFYEQYDQHFFELNESPLGKYNSKQIEFSFRQGKGF
jgi:hypothetical protein